MPVTDPGVQTDQSGLPIFGAGTPVQNNNPTNIWFADLPADLQGIKIWYDIGRRKVTSTPAPYLPGASVPMPGDALQGSAGSKVPAIGPAPELTTKEPYNKNVSPADILKQIAALQANNPEGLESIQALMSSGVWGTVNVSGVFDDDTESALINAMQRYYKLAHGSGVAMSFMDYLQSAGTRALQNQQQQDAAGASAPAPFQANLTDPTTIRASAQAAAEQALGRALPADQLEHFISQFQAAQTAAQRQEYNNAVNGGGGASVSQPDLTSQAMEFAQETHPKAYERNQRESYLDALVQLFGGVRPSITPTPAVGG